MSRVERTENPTDRRDSEQLRAQRGRRDADRDPSVGHTPTKAEGEVDDVEEALKRSSDEG